VHTIASVEQEVAGPSYSVPALAAASARFGENVALYSVGTPGVEARDGFNHHRFAADLQRVPVLRAAQMSRGMLTALKKSRADIVHTHGLWLMPNVYGAWAKKQSGAKFVLSPRGMLAPAALSFSRTRKRIFSMTFQDRALRAVDLFHATSVQEHDDIRARGLTQPVAIIPNGIDVPPASTLEATKKEVSARTLLYLGRIHAIKNLDSLIAAWDRVEPDFPDWDLKIVGPGQQDDVLALRAAIARSRARRVMVHEGFYGRDKVRALAAADLNVLPSRSENFGMTIEESLAAGTPVICTRGAPWPGLETHGCGLWIDHGVYSLEAALRHAMSLSSEDLSAMGQRGRAWMSRDFAWDAVGRQIGSVYRWLVSPPGTPVPQCVRLTTDDGASVVSPACR